jgi:uncharacterized protein
MEENKQIIKFLLAIFPDVKGIYLFGSRADNSARADSDWDIALLFSHTQQIDNQQLWNARWDLGGQLNAPVDLINLREVAITLRAEIIATGIRIYTSDDYYCDSYDMTTYSMYTKYSEEVKDIVEDIKKRGFVRYQTA